MCILYSGPSHGTFHVRDAADELTVLILLSIAQDVRMPFDRFYESLFHLAAKLFPDSVAPTDAFQRVRDLHVYECTDV